MTGQAALDFGPRLASEGQWNPEVLGPVLLRLLGRGRAQARRARDISGVLGIPERRARALVEDLRNGGVLIGSSSTEPAGFYLIETEEELEQTAAHLRSRALSVLSTVSAMRRAARERFGEQAATLFDLEAP